MTIIFPPEEACEHWAATRIFVALFGDPKYGIWTHGVPHVCALMDGLIHKHFIWINHRLVHSWPSNCNTPSSRPVPNNLKTHKYLPSMCTKYGSMVFMWNHTTRFRISKNSYIPKCSLFSIMKSWFAVLLHMSEKICESIFRVKIQINIIYFLHEHNRKQES